VCVLRVCVDECVCVCVLSVCVCVRRSGELPPADPELDGEPIDIADLEGM